MSCSFIKLDLCRRFLLGALLVGVILPTPVSGEGSNSSQESTGQVLSDPQGNVFMEELPSDKQSSQKQVKEKLVPDLSTVDVPVDPNGNIVPLINKDTGPVLPFYSQFEETVQPLWQFAPVYPYAYPLNPYIYPTPYSYYPGYQPYGINLRFGKVFASFGANPPLPYGSPVMAPINPWFTPPLTPVLPNF